MNGTLVDIVLVEYHQWDYPLVNVHITTNTMFNGQIYYKWPCSVAVSNYRRVCPEINSLIIVGIIFVAIAEYKWNSNTIPAIIVTVE